MSGGINQTTNKDRNRMCIDNPIITAWSNCVSYCLNDERLEEHGTDLELRFKDKRSIVETFRIECTSKTQWYKTKLRWYTLRNMIECTIVLRLCIERLIVRSTRLNCSLVKC